MTFLDHARDYSLRAYVRSHKVNIHHSTEILHTHIGHRNALYDSGIVDKNIYSAHRSFYISYHCLYSLFVSHITQIPFGIYAEFLISLHATVDSLLT